MIEWVAHCSKSLDSIFENKHNCSATSVMCTEYHNLYALLFVFVFDFAFVFFLSSTLILSYFLCLSWKLEGLRSK